MKKTSAAFIFSLGLIIYAVKKLVNRTKSIDSGLSEPEIISVLQSLAKAEFDILIDLSQIALQLLARGRDKDLVRESLLSSDAKEKLREEDRACLSSHGISDPSGFAEFVMLKSIKSQKILDVLIGLDNMYEDALLGLFPIMPGVCVNPEISEVDIMKYSSQLQQQQRSEVINALEEWIENHAGEYAADFEDSTTDFECCKNWLKLTDYSEGFMVLDLPPIVSAFVSTKMRVIEQAFFAKHKKIFGDMSNFYQALAIHSRKKEFISEWRVLQHLHNSLLFERVENLLSSY